jgi:glycosyltransferase involved in cell wall biosynthesis
MKISIIIPTYNRGHYITETIDSFVNQNYPSADYEIIISDNNSTDDTESIIQSKIAENLPVQLSYFKETKQGVHYARNSAAKRARYELLYFTDDDMIADPELLNEIVRPFIFDEKVGTATGRVLPKWEVPPPAWVERLCNNAYLSLLDPPTDFLITRDIDNLYSCHQAIRRDVFFMTEGFNPENTKGVWVGDGETGLNIKIKQMGYKFAFNGKSVIHHIIPPSRLTQTYLNKRIGNGAYCHAYTTYREQRPSNFGLLIENLRLIFVAAPVKFLSIFWKTVKTKDFHYLRFAIAHIFYFYKRLNYNFKILFNPNWKKFVLKNNWLSDDEEFYTDIK